MSEQQIGSDVVLCSLCTKVMVYTDLQGNTHHIAKGWQKIFDEDVLSPGDGQVSYGRLEKKLPSQLWVICDDCVREVVGHDHHPFNRARFKEQFGAWSKANAEAVRRQREERDS